MSIIDKEWKIYPVGVVFGLGFDTATEVLLLGTTAFMASQHLPWYAIMCLPILFTAGMTLMDTTDDRFMNLAYGWAFFNPVRKVYYNLADYGPRRSGSASLIGGIEVLSLILPGGQGPLARSRVPGLHRTTSTSTPPGSRSSACSSSPGPGPWLVWRYGRIEETWSAKLGGRPHGARR